jgi:glycerate 2-kinase
VTPLADVARSMFAASVAAAAPDALIRRIIFLPDGVEFTGHQLRPAGAMHLVALGKAAPGLAAAFLHRSHRAPDSVFVLAPEGVPTPASVAAFTRYASHPLPGERGAAATRELLGALATATPADGVVVLLSGGTSALLALTLPGVPPGSVAAVTAALLDAGAPIQELNAVRKHILAAAGGRLAAACPASILALVVSDVPGDDLATIASGPTVADPTTFAEALSVLERRAVVASCPDLATFLADGARGAHPESPKPGVPALARARTEILGSSRDALAGAASAAQRAGFRTCELTRRLHGEAREVGRALAALATALVPGEPAALLCAGETTVSVRGTGRGGRNLEVALAAACVLAGVPERCILAAGTDGADGVSPAAGAVVDGETLIRAAAYGRDAVAALADNDAWGFFDGLPEAIVTGPTGTNVADLAFVLAAGGVPDFLPAATRLVERLPAVRGKLAPRRGDACRTPGSWLHFLR